MVRALETFGLLAAVAAISLTTAHPANASSACKAAAAEAGRKVGPDWQAINTGIDISHYHPSGAAIGFQCNDGEPMYGYIQLPVEGTDITPMHDAVTEVAQKLLAAHVSSKTVRNCILKVKKTTASDIWRAIEPFGKAFECGKDDSSHYFRIAPVE